ncbi:MAG: pilus assembly protein PilP [Elusimicrobia bacterium]|jgi:Tfp pilus assembly protein PilP|nr:pilus assembly protein PilP [Elusimicrobiota bacterium]
MKKIIIYSAAVIVFASGLTGCGGEDKAKTVKRTKKSKEVKIEKPEEITVPEFTYTADKYRSPFSQSMVRRSRPAATVSKDSGDAQKFSPESLTVTGVFSDNQGKYALLSGAGAYFVVKNGRIYNDDDEEEPGVAAIIKEDKIILITDEDTMYELTIPE